jgi:hypothetical protein
LQAGCAPAAPHAAVPRPVKNAAVVEFFSTRGKHPHTIAFPRKSPSGSPAALFGKQGTAQWHCARARRVVLFLLGKKALPQQSERSEQFRRGPALCGGAKFGMVY